jgi:hypothetical protein
MTKRAPYSRIAITIPAEDLAAADELARQQDRSRSWIIAEAVRKYVAAQATGAQAAGAQAATALSTVVPLAQGRTTSPGVGESRLLQLRRDLALTPEQRVLLADETLRNVPKPSAPQGPRSFDRYEDFLDWKLLRAVRP